MPTTYDPDLLDALESVEASWTGSVWRQVIGSLDPMVPNTRGLWEIPAHVGGAAAWLGAAGLLVPSALVKLQDESAGVG